MFARKLLFTVAAIMFFMAASEAQRRGGGDGYLDAMKAHKTAYLTERLALTQADSAKFFPLYDELEAKRWENRRKQTKLTHAMSAMSDGQLAENIDELLALRAAEVAFEKEYMTKFQKTITIRQVAALMQAEAQYKLKLLDRFGRQGKRGDPSGD